MKRNKNSSSNAQGDLKRKLFQATPTLNPAALCFTFSSAVSSMMHEFTFHRLMSQSFVSQKVTEQMRADLRANEEAIVKIIHAFKALER